MNPYDWPPDPRVDAWALKIKLEALCRVHEAKQGWIPVRLIRRVIGR